MLKTTCPSSCILLLLLCLMQIFQSQEMSPKSMYTRFVFNFRDSVRTDFLLQSESNLRTALECQTICLKNIDCMSFFYNSNLTVCQTHSILFFNADDGTSSNGWNYYQKVDFDRRTGIAYHCNRRNEMCYNFHLDQTLTWPEARTACQDQLADLIVLDTYDKALHMASTINSTSFVSKRFIAGLSDAETEGNWVWVNGKPVDYQLWVRNQPDNGLGSRQDYGVIWKVSKFPNFLNDDDMIKLHYICEIPYNVIL